MAGSLGSRDDASDWEFRYHYEILRAILNRNGRTLQILADLEADLNHLTYYDARIYRPVKRLLEETYLMAQELDLLSNRRYSGLFAALDCIRLAVAEQGKKAPNEEQYPDAVGLNEEEALVPRLVGGKAAGLSSLYHNFPGQVPEGFILTTRAYNLFLGSGNLFEQIRILLKNLEFLSDRSRFTQRVEAIREAIVSEELPETLQETILKKASEYSREEKTLWAVRSSAVNEDGKYSFAGQFDSLLNVPTEKLPEAYKKVLAGKFTDRAVTYRLHCGIREVDTPMAVLFMPMIEPQAAGVIYTTDPMIPDSGSMVMNCVSGLGDRVVKGVGIPDQVIMSRKARPDIVSMKAAETSVDSFDYISREIISDVGAAARKAAVAFGCDLDIEWAVDKKNRIWLLQGRRMHPSSHEKIREASSRKAELFIAKGTSIFPGRAEGPVAIRSASNLASIPKGAVLLVDQPIPELAPLLPGAAAVVAAEGSPVGHLATLLREFSIPSVFQTGSRILDLKENSVISVDASMRKIYRGSCWPGIKERVLARLASSGNRKDTHPLYNLVLSLNLSDPFAPEFKPGSCSSVHDIIRFIHEMSIRSMFRFGDEHSGFLHRKTRRLDSGIPMLILTLALDQALESNKKTVAPESLSCLPFQAFWKGFSDSRLAWPDRWGKSFFTISKDIQDQVFGGTKGPRKRKDPNYLIYAGHYMNFNARFAYHYAMVDSLLGTGDRNNYIQLRFHSGGGSDTKRKRRAQFLERVLRECRFGVTLEGDLIVAWFRNYPSEDTAKALETLGRLLVCSRQLDMLMHIDSDVKMFSDHFLAGKFQVFS